MKNEFTEEQVTNLKAILHKGVSVWLERNNVDTKRVKVLTSINQSKINTDISINFVIEPKKDD